MSLAYKVVQGNNNPKALKKAYTKKKKENPIIINKDKVKLGAKVIKFLNVIQEI